MGALESLMHRRHRIRRVRRQARPAHLLWRVTYGDDKRVGVGMVLHIHEKGCRIAGSMPVTVGMRLWLRLWPDQFPNERFETHGTVKWTEELEFGLVLDKPQTAMR
jgi:hypothetical protein